MTATVQGRTLLATQAFFSAYAVVARERRTRRIEFKRARQVLSIVAIVGLVSLLYLTQTSQIAATGYHIRELERQKEKLVRENQELRYRIGKLDSLKRIEERAVQLGFKPVARGDYLSVAADLQLSASAPVLRPSSAASGGPLAHLEPAEPSGIARLWDRFLGALANFGKKQDLPITMGR
jgi:cell division protein FtsL